MDKTAQKLLTAAKLAEDKGSDELAFALTKLAREVSSAKTVEIKLDSWTDFITWWNQNRSQDMLFNLIDVLGENHPVIASLKEIDKEMQELEKKLHDVYLQLKNQAGGAAAAPAPEETGEPVLEETLGEPPPAEEPPAEEPKEESKEEE